MELFRGAVVNTWNFKGKYGTIVCHVLASDWEYIKTGVHRNQINIKGNVKQYNVCNFKFKLGIRFYA